MHSLLLEMRYEYSALDSEPNAGTDMIVKREHYIHVVVESRTVDGGRVVIKEIRKKLAGNQDPVMKKQ